MDVKLPAAWKELLAPEFEKPYFRELADFVRVEYTAAARGEGPPIYPAARNIFKEIHDDLGTPIPPTGNLDRWAGQGVLLLNASLTVREAQPNSHADKGWQTFTDAVVGALGETKQEIVYMLWGAFAQRKGCEPHGRLNDANNLILKAAHPSPLSAHNGFFGCRHFSKANEYLIQTGKTPIAW